MNTPHIACGHQFGRTGGWEHDAQEGRPVGKEIVRNDEVALDQTIGEETFI